MAQLTARFWDKVDKTGECWIWKAGCNPDGYGMFKLSGMHRVAHRLAYMDLSGPIPEGLTLDHLCRNRACCNPAHLEPVTQRENVLRGNGWAGLHARQTHCHRGHELAGDNLRIQRNGARRCRRCARENMRRYRSEASGLEAAA